MPSQMKQPNEAYAWISTWNNPQKHLEGFEDFDYPAATPEQFTELQLKVIDMFVHASPRARKPDTSSIIVACEAGSTFHCHMLFAAKRKIPFTSLQNIYPGIHLEPAFGTWEQCSDYLHKEGSEANEAKAHTKLCEPLSWGTWQYTPKDQMPRQSVFDCINALLDEGYTPQQMYEMDSKLAYYANAIERTYLARCQKAIKPERQLTTYAHFGESGSGKSHVYVELAEKYGMDRIHRVSGDYTWIFDGYVTGQHEILFLDEYRDSKIDYSVLLSYLDKYPLKLNVKNSRAYSSFTECHINSVIPIEHWYRDEQAFAHETREQLYRRIDFVVFHWKDDTGYHQYQIPMSEYEGYDQLEYRATGKCSNPFAKLSTPALKEPDTVQAPASSMPKETPKARETSPPDRSERTDFDRYYDWEKSYLPIMGNEPVPLEFEDNPFISFDFGIGVMPTEFDAVAFLESMGQL